MTLLGFVRSCALLLALAGPACAPPSAVRTVATSPQTTQAAAPAPDVIPPQEEDSVRLAIIGDSGTGTRTQYEVAAELIKARTVFPYEFVIMLGDNIYGSERPQDFAQKFEKPYQALLDAEVPFYASLGNHDDPTQRFYKPFNMNGERYYTYTKDDVRFFVLDSNYMDRPQLRWLEEELARAGERWKVAYFHHPLYSSGGRHGSEEDLRALLEPLFLEHGVDVVFAGHEHFYERIRPQRGIHYFTVGGSAKLRPGDIERGPLTAAGFDTDHSFMLAEFGETQMAFQAHSRTGRRVDQGTLALAAEPERAPDGATAQR